MNNQEVALEFIERFCAGDINGIEHLLSADLRFRGPFYEFNSAEEYITSLLSNPPERCGFNILSITEGDDSLAVFYDYKKPEGVIRIAQLFKFKELLISEMLLVFDGRGFDQQQQNLNCLGISKQ
jgi:hypothetical protein